MIKILALGLIVAVTGASTKNASTPANSNGTKQTAATPPVDKLLAAEKAPKVGTYYRYAELGISKKEVKGSRIHFTFKPKSERFHWCPGVKVKSIKDATIVTFVRSKTSQNFGVDTQASIGKHLVRKLSIDTRGKDTYVRNGPKKFTKVYSVPKNSSSKQPRMQNKVDAKSTSTKSTK